MSKECIDQCPRIRKILDDIESSEIMGIAIFKFPIDLDESDNQKRLKQAYEDASNCSGPQTCKRVVQKGFFKKRMAIEEQRICGLDHK